MSCDAKTDCGLPNANCAYPNCIKGDHDKDTLMSNDMTLDRALEIADRLTGDSDLGKAIRVLAKAARDNGTEDAKPQPTFLQAVNLVFEDVVGYPVHNGVLDHASDPVVNEDMIIELRHRGFIVSTVEDYASMIDLINRHIKENSTTPSTDLLVKIQNFLQFGKTS